MTREQIREFIRESNRIEGIYREPTDVEIGATKAFLENKSPDVVDLSILVNVYQRGARLRNEPGMNVRVGHHLPPPGGPAIAVGLQIIVLDAVKGVLDPFSVHQEFETLHPFTDGNGRTGRALWLWQMEHQRHGIMFGFLHTWYYQSLQHGR